MLIISKQFAVMDERNSLFYVCEREKVSVCLISVARARDLQIASKTTSQIKLTIFISTNVFTILNQIRKKISHLADSKLFFLRYK